MRDQGQRRIFLAVVMLMLLTMLLSACAAPAGTGAPAAAAPVPTKSPEQAKTLSILYWQAPTILNPHQATGHQGLRCRRVILEPLATYNEKDELVPYLAAEIPTIENGGVADDGTSVTWKLKARRQVVGRQRLHGRRRRLHLAVLCRPGDGLHDQVQL